MKTQIHMPHLPHGDGRKHPMAQRLGRLEGGLDYVVIALVIALGAAMFVGLFSASGYAPW